MRKERLIIDYLLDKRLGRVQDYSIPEQTTFFPTERPLSGRLVDASSGGCSIPMQFA